MPRILRRVSWGSAQHHAAGSAVGAGRHMRWSLRLRAGGVRSAVVGDGEAVCRPRRRAGSGRPARSARAPLTCRPPRRRRGRSGRRRGRGGAGRQHVVHQQHPPGARERVLVHLDDRLAVLQRGRGGHRVPRQLARLARSPPRTGTRAPRWGSAMRRRGPRQPDWDSICTCCPDPSTVESGRSVDRRRLDGSMPTVRAGSGTGPPVSRV
jgi:hypothetical protein